MVAIVVSKAPIATPSRERLALLKQELANLKEMNVDSGADSFAKLGVYRSVLHVCADCFRGVGMPRLGEAPGVDK